MRFTCRASSRRDVVCNSRSDDHLVEGVHQVQIVVDGTMSVDTCDVEHREFIALCACSAVRMLDSKQDCSCSSFLLLPNVIATAAHNLDSIPLKQLIVVTGQNNSHSIRKSLSINPENKSVYKAHKVLARDSLIVERIIGIKQEIRNSLDPVLGVQGDHDYSDFGFVELERPISRARLVCMVPSPEDVNVTIDNIFLL